MQHGRSRFLTVVLWLGMAFLYIPLILLVVYSFNYSKLVPVWGGWSLRWYVVLFQSEEVWAAVWLSLRIAVVNATAATLLGTLAGLAMVRFGRFRGRTLFGGMLSAPLVMPEVITGLSLLLLFITLNEWIGWPSQRGFSTITIAHITFSLAYVAVIIQSRLTGMGQDLEEAALDLGAKPLRVLMDITLPRLAPGMLAGWLLAFTLSLDDLVIASFVTGPGSSTLPILIYSRIRLGLRPDINALATIIILSVAIGVADRGVADAAAAEDGGGRGGRPVTGRAMSATASEEHYPLDSILFLEEMWGDGFLSPGGPEEVRAPAVRAGRRGQDGRGHRQRRRRGCGAAGGPVRRRAGDRAGRRGDRWSRTRGRRPNARGWQDRIEIRRVEPGPMPLADASVDVDVVFSKDSIVHIPDKEALAADAFRVLRPGGWFVASDWLISHDGEPSPEMADYLAKEDLDFGMASPARYRRALEKRRGSSTCR